MNVVGGYVVTGRMLKMFRRRPAPVPAGQAGQVTQAGHATQAVQAAHMGQATPDGQAGQAGRPSQLDGGGTRS